MELKTNKFSIVSEKHDPISFLVNHIDEEEKY